MQPETCVPVLSIRPSQRHPISQSQSILLPAPLSLPLLSPSSQARPSSPIVGQPCLKRDNTGRSYDSTGGLNTGARAPVCNVASGASNTANSTAFVTPVMTTSCGATTLPCQSTVFPTETRAGRPLNTVVQMVQTSPQSTSTTPTLVTTTSSIATKTTSTPTAPLTTAIPTLSTPMPTPIALTPTTPTPSPIAATAAAPTRNLSAEELVAVRGNLVAALRAYASYTAQSCRCTERRAGYAFFVIGITVAAAIFAVTMFFVGIGNARSYLQVKVDMRNSVRLAALATERAVAQSPVTTRVSDTGSQGYGETDELESGDYDTTWDTLSGIDATSGDGDDDNVAPTAKTTVNNATAAAGATTDPIGGFHHYTDRHNDRSQVPRSNSRRRGQTNEISARHHHITRLLCEIEDASVSGVHGSHYVLLDTRGHVYAHGDTVLRCTGRANQRPGQSPSYQSVESLQVDGGTTAISRAIEASRRGGAFIHYRGSNDVVYIAYACPVANTGLIIMGVVPVPEHAIVRAKEIADRSHSSQGSSANMGDVVAPMALATPDFTLGTKPPAVLRTKKAMAAWGGMGVINGWRPRARA